VLYSLYPFWYLDEYGLGHLSRQLSYTLKNFLFFSFFFKMYHSKLHTFIGLWRIGWVYCNLLIFPLISAFFKIFSIEFWPIVV